MILLTGGTGLIGRHILAALRQRGHHVLALSRRGSADLRNTGVDVLEGEVADRSTWDRVGGVDAIIHSAASVFTRSDWPAYRCVNVDATRFAAERARVLGVPLIHISSVAVYGRHQTRPVTEQHPIGPLDAGEFYPRSKRLAEQVLWAEVGRGLRAVALRPCVVYGEGDRLFLPKLVHLARRGWFPMIGDGMKPLPLVYAGNVADGAIAALESGRGWGKAYNLTNDDEITGDELVAGIARGLQHRVRSIHIPSGLARVGATAIDALRPLTGSHLPPVRGGVAFLSAGNAYSSAAAVAELGWQPSQRHMEALPRAVRWLVAKERT